MTLINETEQFFLDATKARTMLKFAQVRAEGIARQ